MRHTLLRNPIAGSIFAAALAAGSFLPVLALAHTGGTASIAAAQPALLNGMLVRTVAEPRVYFLQGGKRRPVLSPSAFTAQGFSWSDVTTVGNSDLAGFPEGDPIDTTEPLGLTVEKVMLPDLVPLAPYDVRYATVGGRVQLKFTATFWNKGKAALELTTNRAAGSGDGDFAAHQNIYRPDGSKYQKAVGKMYWHGPHNHYHFDDFGEYELELLELAPGATAPAQNLTSLKTTFCMRDDLTIAVAADGPRQARKYTGCTGTIQGVSVGWADVYPHTLPDQFFDVTDLPAGRYAMRFIVDHTGTFSESRRDNNVSVTVVDIDPAKRTVKVAAVVSPFNASSNRFADGMLIKGDRGNDVYLIKNNRRYLLEDEAIVASYGKDLSKVINLPQDAVDRIPFVNLIKPAGSGTLYFLNPTGFRRKVLSPDVLRSYGAGAADILEVSAEDFARIKETTLIKRADSDRVYSIVTKTYVGTMRELAAAGNVVSAVHVANETDFGAYAVEVVGRDFNVPWDIAFLPDGDMLVTERPGVLRRVGKNPVSIELPGVHDFGEGGLMGVVLHPDYASNKFLYMYYTSMDGGKRNRIIRYVFDGATLKEDKVIADNIPSAIYHDGGRIAFGPDGMLYATTGDANDPDRAQDRGSLAGKTLRYTPDGGIPADNPFPNSPVWSMGHRNSQGIAWDGFGNMWETEHGRSGVTTGYDELNLIRKGANYGWPDFESNEQGPGMTLPVVVTSSRETWAPGSLTFMDGSLFFAGLRGETLYEAVPDASGKVTAFRKHLVGHYGRLRAVVPGPGGTLYVTTSNRDSRGTPGPGDDKILRVYPQMLPR